MFIQPIPLERMGAAAKGQAHLDTAERVADLVEALLG